MDYIILNKNKNKLMSPNLHLKHLKVGVQKMNSFSSLTEKCQLIDIKGIKYIQDHHSSNSGNN